jgi:hypothetical protein
MTIDFADFQTVAFALRLKALFQDNKDKVKKHTQGKFLANRKSLIKFINPLITKAYNNGSSYAANWAATQLKEKKNPKEIKLSEKDRKKLLLFFIERVKQVEELVKQKMKGSKKMQELHGITRNVEGNEMFEALYLGEIKKAVNFTIAEAGNFGKDRTLRPVIG